MEYFTKNEPKLVINYENWLKKPQHDPLDLLNPPGCLSTRWARLFGTIRYTDVSIYYENGDEHSPGPLVLGHRVDRNSEYGSRCTGHPEIRQCRLDGQHSN